MSKTTRRVYKIAAAAAFTAGSVAAIPATFAAEAPADQQQVVDQKASSQTSSLPGGNATETPKAEAPKTEATEAPKAETHAPTTPATPEPTSPDTPAPEVKQADPSIVIEDARFPADAQLNTVNIVGAGFYGEKVGPGVQVSIYALDADNQITGEALATVVVPADQIQDGTFKGSITVETSKLPAGASYALSAVSNPQSQPDQRLVAISSFKVTESVTHAPETPKEETPAPVTPAPEAPKEETPVPVTPTPEAPKEEAPAPEAPKDETPAPEAPKEEPPAPEAPKEEPPAPEAPAVPENATLTTEDASLDPNDQYNVLTFNGSGFTHESVANGVQIAIFRLDARDRKSVV